MEYNIDFNQGVFLNIGKHQIPLGISEMNNQEGRYWIVVQGVGLTTETLISKERDYTEFKPDLFSIPIEIPKNVWIDLSKKLFKDTSSVSISPVSNSSSDKSESFNKGLNIKRNLFFSPKDD